MNNVLALFAFAILLVFLGILVWSVPRLDLIFVVSLTVLLAGWDLVQNLKGNHDS
jgi:hypothetical protein